MAAGLAGADAPAPQSPAVGEAAGLWTTPADFSGGFVSGSGETKPDETPKAPTAVVAPPRRTWWQRLWPARRISARGPKAGRKPTTNPRSAPTPSAGAGRPGRAKAGKRRAGLARSPVAGPAALLFASTATLALIVIGRAQVVAAAPSTARLFAAVGLPVNTVGLSFADVRSSLAQEEAGRFLVVEALVLNEVPATRRVPPIEIRLIDRDGRVGYTWTAEPPRSALRPGESLHFRTRLATPPETARSVELRFGSAMSVAAPR